MPDGRQPQFDSILGDMSDTLCRTWHAMDSCVHERVFQDGGRLWREDPDVRAMYEKYDGLRRPLVEVITGLNDVKFFAGDWRRDRPGLEVRSTVNFIH